MNAILNRQVRKLASWYLWRHLSLTVDRIINEKGSSSGY